MVRLWALRREGCFDPIGEPGTNRELLTATKIPQCPLLLMSSIPQPENPLQA